MPLKFMYFLFLKIKNCQTFGFVQKREFSPTEFSRVSNFFCIKKISKFN